MLQTFLVYFLLLGSMFTMSYFSSSKQQIILGGKPSIVTLCNRYWILLALLLYSFVFGARYGVGVDYYGYKGIYESQLGLGRLFPNDRIEPAFNILIRALTYIDAHFFFFFFIVAFIQVSLLYYAFRDKSFIFPLFTLSFILSRFWLEHFMNAMRQGIAISLFVVALSCIVNRKLLQYFALISVAALFHKSAVLLYPLYYIFHSGKSYFQNVKTQILLLICSITLGGLDIIIHAFQIISPYLVFLDYDGYINSVNLKDNLLFRDATYNIGGYISMLPTFLIIVMNKEYKSFYGDKRINIMYDLFIIGAIMKNLFIGSIVLTRPFMYLDVFYFITIAFFLYYLHTKSLRNHYFKIIFLGMISSMVLLFILALLKMESNTMLFAFFWQEDMRLIKDGLRNLIF